MTTLREAIDAKGEPGECIVVPFHAMRRGERVLVTAVLKRTAIFQDQRPNERHLDLHDASRSASWSGTTAARRTASRHRGIVGALRTKAASGGGVAGDGRSPS